MITASSPTPAEFEVAFVAGFGQLLDDVGVGQWSPAGPPDANDEPLIVAGALPSSPDHAVALMAYGVTDDPSLSDSVLGLQAATRAPGSDPRGTDRLRAALFDQLDGMTGVVLPGGVYVVQCHLQSWASTGQDQNQRWRAVSNFYVAVHRPSKNRT